MEMMNVKTYVLGRDAGGSSDFFETDVSLSRSSYDLGEHYDVAIKRAEEAGYETPMEAFDEFEPAGKALARLQSMQTVEAIGGNAPTVLVWLGEGGVEELIADFPLRYVVVSTDTEYADDDCLHQINTGNEIHEALCHTGVGTVKQHEAGFVWNQVRRLAEPGLWQPVDYRDLDTLPADLSNAPGISTPNQATAQPGSLQDAIVKHRRRYRKALGMDEVHK